jgi:mitogen-activated protein kinase 1/3
MASEAELKAFWSGADRAVQKDYTNVKLIGSGAYSVVARAVETATGETVAIKRISEVFYDAQEAKKVLREIRLLRDFHHPNVISLRGLAMPANIETFDDIFMITEFMESDMRRIIKTKQSLEVNKVRSFMAQLCAGLTHVHAISGIHRDLKPANILVSTGKVTPATPFGVVRLCDFGLARVDSNPRYAKRLEETSTQVDNAMEDAAEGVSGGGDAADTLARGHPPQGRGVVTHGGEGRPNSRGGHPPRLVDPRRAGNRAEREDTGSNKTVTRMCHTLNLG